MSSPKSATEHKSNFLEQNAADITEVPPEAVTLGDFDEIDELDDEVWLMQCPKGMDVTKLAGERLKLPGRSKIAELETVAIELNVPKKEAFGYTNRKGRYAIRLLPISGSVVLRKPLKTNDPITTERIQEVMGNSVRVPRPKIKVRHPLLGVNYEVKLQEVSKPIIERLKRADETSSLVLREALTMKNSAKMRKSKSKRLSLPTFIKVEIEDDIEFVSETKHKKKKRSRKHSERGDMSATDMDVHVAASPNKSRKIDKSKSSVEIDSDLRWLKEL